MVRRAVQDAMLPPGALTVPTGARYLGVSEPTLWRMLRDNELTRVKLRGRTVVRRVDCDALLARLASAAG